MTCYLNEQVCWKQCRQCLDSRLADTRQATVAVRSGNSSNSWSSQGASHTCKWSSQGLCVAEEEQGL